MRTIFFSLLVYVCLLPFTPVTHAAHTETHKNAELYAQIEYLRTQISDLKERISAQNEAESEEIYQTVLFSEEFTGIYEISSTTTLNRIDASEPVPAIHSELWFLFLDTVGTTNAKQYVDEFRVYKNADSAISGFVEVKPHFEGDEPEWVLAVNAVDYLPDSSSRRELYTELYIHEFGHMILYEMPHFVADFTDTYWTSNDHAHSEELAEIAREDVEAKLEAYYADREDAFVSDYATLNPDEDMAETFTSFVLTNKPARGNTTKNRKIRSFYNHTELVEIRTDIREYLALE